MHNPIGRGYNNRGYELLLQLNHILLNTMSAMCMQQEKDVE